MVRTNSSACWFRWGDAIRYRSFQYQADTGCLSPGEQSVKPQGVRGTGPPLRGEYCPGITTLSVRVLCPCLSGIYVFTVRFYGHSAIL